MKQENRLVADLYHYLKPFIDNDKNIYFCLDGGAAKHYAENDSGTLNDSVLPDLWFSLVGQDGEIGIEAKVIDGNSISFRQCQIQAWRTKGLGEYCPEYWVATNKELSHFYCWHHRNIRARLDSTSSTVDNVLLSLANYPADYESNSIQGLALFILQGCAKNA